MQTKTIDGQTFIKMVSGGAANLRANASIVNESQRISDSRW